MFGKGEIIMKRVIKTASAILLALAMTTPAFAAPTDTDTTTDTPIATPTAAPSTSTRFTDINSEEFAWQSHILMIWRARALFPAMRTIHSDPTMM